MKNGRQIKIRYFVASLSFLVSAIKIAVLASPSPVLSPAGARLLGHLCATVSASVVDRRLSQPSPYGLPGCPAQLIPRRRAATASRRRLVRSVFSAACGFGTLREPRRPSRQSFPQSSYPFCNTPL